MENRLIVLTFIFMALFLSCKHQPDTTSNNTTDSTHTEQNKSSLIITQPQNGKVFKYLDTIEVVCSNHIFLPNDTIKISINKLPFSNFIVDAGTIKIFTSSLRAGTNQIYISLKQRTEQLYASFSVVIISRTAPQEYTYRMVKRFPHDDRSYTQGLEFYEGYMYEGSGQYGESMLRKYKLETGELIQSYNLPNNVFGEGIVVYKQKIYQLTWQSRIAYEFDLKTFQLLRTFEFNTEGWGLTKYNDMLVMSDGSNRLYFLNPENFIEIDRLEVYNHVGPVTQLNELEYIDGYIYANIYLTNNIAIINPQTGFVEGIIKLDHLLDESKVNRKADVLNGIAYDISKKRLFVTGKYWPEIYQIELIPVK